MNNKLFLSAAAALAVFVAGPAIAADIPVKAPPRPAPVFSWTGCYIGVNGGWIGNREDVSTFLSGSFRDPANIFGRPPALGSLDRSFDIDGNGGTAGITTGCNVQAGNWVFGYEGDTNWSGIDETVSLRFPITAVPGQALSASSSLHTVHKELQYFSTYRLRAGVAFDRMLLYVTGGAVLGRVRGETDIRY